MRFTDRADAGRRLAAGLEHLRTEHPVVLGLPRGGVPVAAQVADALGAPLDVILVRKLGVPYHRELGFGAIGEGGVRVVHDNIVRMSRVGEDDLAEVERTEEAELRRQAERFRGGRQRIPLAGRTAVVVDDGIATGATAAAACRVAKAQGAARVVLAVPVAPPDAAAALRSEVDEVVCLSTPSAFYAVGEWYEDFSQTEDREVIDLLARSVPEPTTPSGPDDPPEVTEREIPVEADGVRLSGDLRMPDGALGVVVFAPGGGSSRRSPRNRFVGEALNEAGLGTLLLDLLTREEELDRANPFAIETLSGRLTEAIRLLRRDLGTLPIGCFGTGTGAAAALRAAADDDAEIAAVVSRSGRPDLAGPRLADVRAPTLLIVGGGDETLLDLNRQAQNRMNCEHRLVVVPDVTHLFEEPGAMNTVSALARDWFLEHLVPSGPETNGNRTGTASTRRHPEAHSGR
ncbi:phosphoribosyltransferase family protein [Streptomyces sp. 8N706]|uniref:phosphoribosyltransferase family protein n=1 Tax=Streptomyces sp. 8N706 TaxID=3457416 RepID=UPI003FD289E4